MPCYKYKFRSMAMPYCPVLSSCLPPELVAVIFRYAFQMDTLAAHHGAVALLHDQRRAIEEMMDKTTKQHTMWSSCTRHGISYEESTHKHTMSLLRRADDFLKRAVRYLPDPVRVVYTEPIVINTVAAVNGYRGPVMPEDVNYFF